MCGIRRRAGCFSAHGAPFESRRVRPLRKKMQAGNALIYLPVYNKRNLSEGSL
jgi:hypothetical protein